MADSPGQHKGWARAQEQHPAWPREQHEGSDRGVRLVHVPKCGLQLWITFLYTHCQRLFGSCTGNGTMAELKSSSSEDCSKGELWNQAACLLKARLGWVDCDDQAILSVSLYMDSKFDQNQIIHYPWNRKYGPVGAILLRNPFRRALSAFMYNGGHLEPSEPGRDGRLPEWWRQNLAEPAPPSFGRSYWKGNFTRYLMYPGVQGCQMRMLLGYKCNEATFDSMNQSLAVEILMRDFKYVGMTDYNFLSVTLYHRMYGIGWTTSPCPQEVKTDHIHHGTTKQMSTTDRVRYFEEYVKVAADSPDRLIYSTGMGIFLRSLHEAGLTFGADPSRQMAEEFAILLEENASLDLPVRDAPPPWVSGRGP